MYVVCSYCNAEFQVEAGTDPVICTKCYRKVPKGTSDWRLVYYEEVHRPLLKGRRQGEKTERDQSRQKQLKRKIAEDYREFKFREILGGCGVDNLKICEIARL